MTSLSCLRCRYDLRSLPATTACPECGLAVSFSLTPPTTLAAAPPSWARTLSIGSALLPLSVIAIPVTSSVVDWLFPLNGTLPMTVNARRMLIHQQSILAVFLVHAVAVWVITTREPRTPRRSRHQLGTWLARLFVLGPSLALAMQIAQGYSRSRIYQNQYIFFVLLSLYIPVPALLFLHLRRLAARIGRPRIAEHTAIVGVGLSSCFASILLANYLPLPNRLANTLAVLPAAFILLFTLWALLLLARLTHAFHRATAEARAAWQSADQNN